MEMLRESWGMQIPDVQIVISDGLDTNAIIDPGHLMPYLDALRANLPEAGLVISDKNIVVIHGRVRAVYRIGNILFEKANPNCSKAVFHIVGERPGTIHRNYSVYMATPKARVWANQTVDHDIARVVSGISDTSLVPAKAAEMTAAILKEMITSGS
jgi:ethanolamine ammonia-lyase large subunit